MGNCLACRAVREIGKWAKSGFPIVQKKERLKICRECEHFDGHRCSKCGCFMIAKALMATSQCPIGKWKAFNGGIDIKP